MKLLRTKRKSIHIRYEKHTLQKKHNLRIAFLSDFHLNFLSKKKGQDISLIVRELSPDLILLGGDYADTPKGLNYFKHLILSLPKDTPIVAILGNHDKMYGKRALKQLFSSLPHCHLCTDNIEVLIHDIKINIVSIFEGSPTGDLNIQLVHSPYHFNTSSYHYDLGFAGHLHGCQWVYKEKKDNLYPGYYFYKWNCLRRKIKDTSYYISRGLGDTLPFRWNCPYEIIVVDI